MNEKSGTPDLEQQIRDLGVGDVVHLLGLRTDVPLLMADLDVLVNVAFMEGTPVVIMEAGAAGVPSIASRVGGCGDMIEEGVTGWLFEFEDQSTATAKVLAALADREATQTVGRQAQEYYLSQNSSADEMAVRHGELYQRLLAARGRR